ncbi:hypothetical protein Trydic_g2576 [Trypoxylus dichotomus]
MVNVNIFYCLLFCIVNFSSGAHDYYWKDYIEDIPPCAISVHDILIAQVPYKGILPAGFYRSTKQAVAEWGGKKIVMTNGIKFLCDKNSDHFTWEYVTSDSLTGDALNNLVVGGFEANYTLYIGLMFHQGEWKVSTMPSDGISFHDIGVARVLKNGQLPASLIGKEAITECNGEKVILTKGIEVLCDTNKNKFEWEHVNVHALTGSKLKELVLGGIESDSELYIGKIFHKGKWQIGKVFPVTSKYSGYRGWNDSDGSTYIAEDFEVLKYPSMNK